MLSSLQDESLMYPEDPLPLINRISYDLSTNLIAVKQVSCPVPGIVSSHVDRKLRFTPLSILNSNDSNETTATTATTTIVMTTPFPLSMKAVVLHMDVHPHHPNWLLASCMNGHVFIIDLLTGETVVQWENHSKYAMSARFIASPIAGQNDWAVSIGHDGLLNVYKHTTKAEQNTTEKTAEQNEPYQLHRQQRFRAPIEAMEIIPLKDANDTAKVIVTLRSDLHFRYIELDSGDEKRFSINGDPRNTHVSYSIMDMALSPCGRYLAVTTDKTPLSYVAVFACGEERQVAGWYVAAAPDLSRSYCRWIGRRLLVSLGDKRVYVLQVGKQTPHASWEAHTSTVRCFTTIDSTAAGVQLATGGFDSQLRLWAYK
ncbi:WD40-repeat-containing domain protein [Syncephalis fuscata]|nr:WD40-repeat-containing domain protein [Syncephalis fuscata]